MSWVVMELQQNKIASTSWSILSFLDKVIKKNRLKLLYA